MFDILCFVYVWYVFTILSSYEWIIFLSISGPFKKTKSDHVFVITFTDHFTKWVDFYPLKSKKAEEINASIMSFIYKYVSLISQYYINSFYSMLIIRKRTFLFENALMQCIVHARFLRLLKKNLHWKKSGARERWHLSLMKIISEVC